MSEQRTLFLSTYAPTLGSGRALRTYTCVRALATLGPVDLAFVTHGGERPSPEYEAIEGVAFHRIDSSRGVRRGLTYASCRLRGTPDVSCRGTSPELVQAARRLAAAPGRGTVVVGDMAAAAAAMLIADLPFVYNAHNIESEYLSGRFSRTRVGHAEMLRWERRVLARASESWMVSRADMRTARSIAPGARLRYAPNAVDVAGIRPSARALTVPAGGRNRLLMVGDFSYLPNVSGLEFFVREVLPRVWRERPDTRLMLVGRGLEAWDPPDARIERAGFVPSLEPYYADADCVVVPLTEGAGTPLKFIEALAYGMPVVATPLAAKGLEVQAGEHYLEAEAPEQFAASVVHVLRDGAPEVARSARVLAEQEYSVQALARHIAEPLPAEPAPAAQTPAEPAGGAHAAAAWVSHAAHAAAGHRYPFVLCYHGVGEVPAGRDAYGIFVTRPLFEQHLDLIAEQGYRLLSAGDLWRELRDRPASTGVGSITFDDGLVKTVREAIPVLDDRGLPSSMFIPTGLMGRPHPDIPGEQIVSPREVVELAAAGVEIGAHSVDHVRLTDLSYEQVLDQLRRSRETLEDLIGAPVTSMAYPFGAFDPRTVRAAAEAGYEVACGCSGPGPWLALQLPREPIYQTASPLRMRLKMAGLYGPAHALRRRRRLPAPARRLKQRLAG